MAWFDISPANAASTAAAVPFINNAYLIVGGLGTSAAGVSGVDTTAQPTSTATVGPKSESTGNPYGVTADSSLSGLFSGLLNNTTFWLALGAVVTIALILKKRKG
jgi:hypothetical protein